MADLLSLTRGDGPTEYHEQADKLARARLYLSATIPFLGYWANFCRFELSTAVKYAQISGRKIVFNPEWIGALSQQEVNFVVAAESERISGYHEPRYSRHEYRRNEETLNRWNAASDAEACLVIKHCIDWACRHRMKLELKMPEKAYFSYFLPIELSLEEYYEYLEMSFQGVLFALGSIPGDGPIDGEPASGWDGEKPGEMEDYERVTANGRAAISARTKGDIVPLGVDPSLGCGRERGGLSMVWDGIENGFTIPETVERRMVQVMQRTERSIETFSKLNKRSGALGIILPGVQNISTDDVAFCVDNSGSIDERLLKRFISSVKSLSESYGVERTHIICCDTRVNKYYNLHHSDNWAGVDFGAGGGTSFQPALDKAATLDASVTYYFTDGASTDYNRLKFPETLHLVWCIYGNPRFAPNIGEVIYMDYFKIR